MADMHPDRKRCAKCLDEKPAGYVEAAHSDYTQPLLVRWLCRSCHRLWDQDDPKTLPHA